MPLIPVMPTCLKTSHLLPKADTHPKTQSEPLECTYNHRRPSRSCALRLTTPPPHHPLVIPYILPFSNSTLLYLRCEFMCLVALIHRVIFEEWSTVSYTNTLNVTAQHNRKYDLMWTQYEVRNGSSVKNTDREKELEKKKRYKPTNSHMWTECEQMRLRGRRKSMTERKDCKKAVYACLALCLSLWPLWRLAPN